MHPTTVRRDSPTIGRRPTRTHAAMLLSVLAVLVGVLVVPVEQAGAQGGRRFIDPVFGSTTVTSDLVYGTAIHHDEPYELKLDLHEPAGDLAEQRPLVVWIHGGSFQTGDPAGPLELYMADALARRGYVVASIGYRLASGSLPADISNAYADAETAVAWLRDNADTYRIDASRVVGAGMSAGAITALSLGSRADVVADPTRLEGPSHVDAVLSYAGTGSPTWPQPGEPPVLMLHGVEDTTVPLSTAEDYCDASNLATVPCELVTYDGPGSTHVGFLVNLPDMVARSAAWMYDELDLGSWVAIAFLDVPADAPFATDIGWMAALGIAGGYPGPVFEPARPVTRQAMAAFLHRLHDRLAAPTGPHPDPGFADVPPTSPFFEDIAWMAATGITTGFPGPSPETATFRPDEPVTRQAMAAFLFRLDELLGGVNPAVPNPGFLDVGPTSPFFAEIAWAADIGLATGFPGPTYRPGSVVTRQAMAAFVHRLYDHVAG
jgi:acetyl esterase/lipase